MAYRHPFPTVENEKAVQILAATRIRPTESAVLGSHLCWLGFHIRMNAYIQVNENPVRKLQPWFSRITAQNPSCIALNLTRSVVEQQYHIPILLMSDA